MNKNDKRIFSFGKIYVWFKYKTFSFNLSQRWEKSLISKKKENLEIQKN